MRKRKFGILFWSLLLVLVCLMAGAISYGENPWEIRINIPEYRLYLYHSGELYQSYYVAVGKQSTPSPIGDFLIINKVANPIWYPPDGRPPVPPGPHNPLGKYWMGITNNGYGIHGNTANWSIGNPVSLGCFRMYNEDVDKLFHTVPVGTPVRIVYQTVLAELDGNNRAWLEVFPDIYHMQNQERAVADAILASNWIYQPNRIAFEELLKGKKPLKIEVPRGILIEGEAEEVDGFYWGQEVYLSKNVVPRLPLGEPGPFAEYVKMKTLADYFEGRRRFNWDQTANTLKIARLKIVLNGLEIDDAGLEKPDKQILVDLKKVAARLGGDLAWNQMATTALCRGFQVSGEVRDDGFWVEMGVLAKIWPGLRYDWKEETWTLWLEEE
jgi:hypothetical protein